MPCPFPARSQLEVFQSVSSVVFPFFVHPRKLTRNLPFQGSIFRFHVSFRGSNQYFVYLFVEFPELLDSSYVQQFFMFQVDKDNVTMKKKMDFKVSNKLQTSYPIPILMNIKSIQILWVNLHPNCQDFLHVPKPSISSSYPRIRWTRDCRGGSVCGALWPLSLGGEAGRWPPKNMENVYGGFLK